MRRMNCTALLWTLSCLTACGLFDSGVPWKSGRFQLMWIDLPDQVTLSYDLGGGGSIGLVDYTVYAVGSDVHHIVVKQHPRGERSITNFYIVDVNSSALPLHPERAVTGPLTQAQFDERAILTSLPRFTTILETLQ
jgi:hypothetical protein